MIMGFEKLSCPGIRLLGSAQGAVQIGLKKRLIEL